MRLPALTLGALLALTGPPPADAVVDRLDAYLSSYLPELATLVADESLEQRVPPRYDSYGRLLADGVTRQLASEIAFVGLPGEDGMLGFRLVTTIDGRTVRSVGTPISELLQRRSPAETRAQLLTQSAEHNLGTPRNTNLPTVPLELLQPAYRDRYSHTLRGRSRIRGIGVDVLVATEIARPTIIRQGSGQSSPSVVTAWVDDRGRVLRAEVRLHAEPAFPGAFEPTVRVDFVEHRALRLLVPSQLRESFWSATHRRAGTGEARYQSFRRFETSGRIVPPPW